LSTVSTGRASGFVAAAACAIERHGFAVIACADRPTQINGPHQGGGDG
jgi:hypothetical protein